MVQINLPILIEGHPRTICAIFFLLLKGVCVCVCVWGGGQNAQLFKLVELTGLFKTGLALRAMCTMSLNYPAEVVAGQLEPAELTVHLQAAGPVLAGPVGSSQSLVVLFGSHR